MTGEQAALIQYEQGGRWHCVGCGRRVVFANMDPYHEGSPRGSDICRYAVTESGRIRSADE